MLDTRSKGHFHLSSVGRASSGWNLYPLGEGVDPFIFPQRSVIGEGCFWSFSLARTTGDRAPILEPLCGTRMDSARGNSEMVASVTSTLVHDGCLCQGLCGITYFHNSLSTLNGGPESSEHQEAMLSDKTHMEEGTSRASKHLWSAAGHKL